MITYRCAVFLVFSFVTGAAAAQTASGPIVGGRQLQPTQEQVDDKVGDAGQQRSRAAQPDLDYLYNEIMRAAKTPDR